MEVDGGKDLHRLVIPFGSNLALEDVIPEEVAIAYSNFLYLDGGRGLKEAFIGIIEKFHVGVQPAHQCCRRYVELWA